MFKWGRFTGASGLELDYKIICDEFTEEDWDCLANILLQKMAQEELLISFAMGVPTGGTPFAKAVNANLSLAQYSPRGRIVICEDVWTTGGSVKRFIQEERLDPALVCVWAAFARGPIGLPARAIFYTEEAD